MAFAGNRPELGGREALEALVIAYEVAARAGLALHGTVSDYHTSGAWNALGVAALGCRLLGHDENTLRHAIGIAEYHGPRSQMMREIDNPSMLHDGSGMGAMVGISSVLLAAMGFTGAPAATVETAEAAPFWQDLGEHWTIEHNYIKPYPICRWAHGSIDAVRSIMLTNQITPDAIASIEVRTFHEGSRLFAGIPENTTQAQYSLPFAVATFLLNGRIGPEHVEGEALSDPKAAELLSLITVKECDRHNDRFPAGRWADATVELKDGTRFESGDINARGGPDSPFSDEELREKFDTMTLRMLGPERTGKIWQAGLGLVEQNARFAPFADLLYAPVNPA
ncbi:MmgE/PrpD family protein [Salaquimonas pukyongi]|uniref:MmgE/PrpD family protein n=1 Tax=Salaquimonas pukyongi TaxID=2712698 RepID=UPI001967D3E0|nr:MmgE/PrpD family protein [Salaquimonas pukyongi]